MKPAQGPPAPQPPFQPRLLSFPLSHPPPVPHGQHRCRCDHPAPTRNGPSSRGRPLTHRASPPSSPSSPHNNYQLPHLNPGGRHLLLMRNDILLTGLTTDERKPGWFLMSLTPFSTEVGREGLFKEGHTSQLDLCKLSSFPPA